MLWVTATCSRDPSGETINYVRVFTDISPLKEAQRKLEQMASYDTLTNLPNRVSRPAGAGGAGVEIESAGWPDVSRSRRLQGRQRHVGPMSATSCCAKSRPLARMRAGRQFVPIGWRRFTSSSKTRCFPTMPSRRRADREGVGPPFLLGTRSEGDGEHGRRRVSGRWRQKADADQERRRGDVPRQAERPQPVSRLLDREAV